MSKKLLLGILASSLLVLSGCGDWPAGYTSPPLEDTSISEISEPQVSISEDTSVSEIVPAEPVSEPGTETERDQLTEVEKAFFTSFIQEEYNYGFVISTYSDVLDADLNEVFYNGYIGEEITDEDYDKYLLLSGETEIYTSLAKISRKQMDEILFQKTGHLYSDFSHGLDGEVEWETETYYIPRGDVNYIGYKVTDGFYADEETVVLHVVPEDDFNYFYGTGYHVTPREVALKKVGNTYQYLSSVDMVAVGMMEDWCYNVTLPYFGNVLVAAYEPTQGNFDVTFKVIEDGTVVQTIYGDYEKNNLIDKTFAGIEDMGFDDFNEDGGMDLFVIAKYLEENNEYSYEAKIFECGEQGYLRYLKEDSIRETEKISSEDPRVDVVMEDMSGSGFQAFVAWKETYIAEIETGDYPDGMFAGFNLIWVDDNDIPELVYVGDCEAAGCTIMTSNPEGQIRKIVTDRLWFTYAYRKGLINNSDGHMGYYFDNVYKVEDGEFELIANGVYQDDMDTEPNGDGTWPMIYEWNGKEVSESKYYEELEKIYPSGYASYGYYYDNLLSREEILALLCEEYTKF